MQRNGRCSETEFGSPRRAGANAMRAVSEGCFLCGSSPFETDQADDQGADKVSFRCAACGEYSITGSAVTTLKQLPRESGIRLCWLARARSDAGHPLTFGNENVKGLLSETPRRSDPLETMDRILLDFVPRAFAPDRMFTFTRADFPLFLCTSTEEMLYWFNVLHKELGFLDRSGELEARPTAKGWRQISDLR